MWTTHIFHIDTAGRMDGDLLTDGSIPSLLVPFVLIEVIEHARDIGLEILYGRTLLWREVLEPHIPSFVDERQSEGEKEREDGDERRLGWWGCLELSQKIRNPVQAPGDAASIEKPHLVLEVHQGNDDGQSLRLFLATDDLSVRPGILSHTRLERLVV
jgi:hypothetical protein